jgi:surfeit locus 1 family protein
MLDRMERLKTLATIGLIFGAFWVLCGLGTWQVIRLRAGDQHKEYRESRYAADPVQWDAKAGMTAAALDYRRVRVRGTWDNAHTMLLANRARLDTLGKEAVTPLQPDDGGPAILVNRGWFPDAERERVLADLAREERATIEGLARNVDLAPGSQTPSGDWTRLDPAVMGKQLPYPVVDWQLTQGRRQTVDDERRRPDSLPMQLYSVDGKAIPHLDYALTWYGLAVALVVVSIVRWRQMRKKAQQTSTLPTTPR